MTEFDENGQPEAEQVPSILDKLGPCQRMAKRRMKLDFLRMAEANSKLTVFPSAGEINSEEHRMFIDALEFVEVYSEDGFCRIMARTALGRRKR